MGTLKKSVVVAVAVVSGAVLCRFGDASGLLGAGMSRVFAGEGDAVPFPEALKGFKGMMIGTIAM